MIEVAGYPKQHTRQSDGAVFMRMYATKSFNKNNEYEQAIEGNIEPMVSEILDPANERFLENVKADRPNVTEDQLTGSIFKAGNAVGTLVDGIGTFSDAVNKIFELRESGNIKNFAQSPPIAPCE